MLARTATRDPSLKRTGNGMAPGSRGEPGLSSTPRAWRHAVAACLARQDARMIRRLHFDEKDILPRLVDLTVNSRILDDGLRVQLENDPTDEYSRSMAQDLQDRRGYAETFWQLYLLDPAASASHHWVHEAGSDLNAFVALTITPDSGGNKTGLIHKMFIRSSQEGKALGLSLRDAVFSFAGENGVSSLTPDRQTTLTMFLVC